jgi:hypothetical protein
MEWVQLQIKVLIDKMIHLEHKILPDIQMEPESSHLIKRNNLQIRVVGDSGQEI